jgi:hypothetical protein
MAVRKFNWENIPATSLESDVNLKNEWDRLNNNYANHPFLASQAVIAALNSFSKGGERLLIAFENNQRVAMFLMAPLGKFQWQTFQPSQMPLGVWVAAEHVPLEDLVRSLLRGPLGFCIALSITQVDPLIARRGPCSPDGLSIDYIETGWIEIEGSFSDYWDARGKNLRQNMRKQRAKLLLENAELRLKVLRQPNEMAPAVVQFAKLESQGWKAKIGTAIHPNTPQGRFYQALLEQASLSGEAVVYQYLMGDAVVAMNLCLLRHGTLVVLKTSYDESIKSYSPAFLLREAELQLFFKERQIKRVEYFGRLMDWHTKFTTQKRTLHHLTIYRWPLLKKISEIRQIKKSQALEAP